MMKIWQSMVVNALVCAPSFASAHLEPETPLERARPRFDGQVYEALYQSGDEWPHHMCSDRKINARNFERLCPLFTDLPPFLEEGTQESPGALRAIQKLYTDTKGRQWYVIDRSGSPYVHPVAATLQALCQDAPPYAHEECVVVRSYAFKQPSRYGCLYTIRNNTHIGKPALFQFTLYLV